MSEIHAGSGLASSARAFSATDGKLFIQKKDALKRAEMGRYR